MTKSDQGRPFLPPYQLVSAAAPYSAMGALRDDFQPRPRFLDGIAAGKFWSLIFVDCIRSRRALAATDTAASGGLGSDWRAFPLVFIDRGACWLPWGLWSGRRSLPMACLSSNGAILDGL